MVRVGRGKGKEERLGIESDRREGQRARRMNGTMQLWEVEGQREPLESLRDMGYERLKRLNGDGLRQNTQ